LLLCKIISTGSCFSFSYEKEKQEPVEIILHNNNYFEALMLGISSNV